MKRLKSEIKNLIKHKIPITKLLHHATISDFLVIILLMFSVERKALHTVRRHPIGFLVCGTLTQKKPPIYMEVHLETTVRNTSGLRLVSCLLDSYTLLFFFYVLSKSAVDFFSRRTGSPKDHNLLPGMSAPGHDAYNINRRHMSELHLKPSSFPHQPIKLKLRNVGIVKC